MSKRILLLALAFAILAVITTMMTLSISANMEKAADAIDMAIACEAAGLAVDDRINNSEGATVSTNRGVRAYGNSHGFIGGYPASRHSLSCAVVGKQGDSMQRDYWYSLSRIGEQLEAPEQVGQQAAQRTLARLGARRTIVLGQVVKLHQPVRRAFYRA